MREFECHEREPLPRQESVDIVALRPHDDATAQELRRSLPEVLAGIVGEVAGARLGLTLLTDADGMVEISVTAAAGDDTPAVLAELAGALEPIAETAVSTEPKSPALSRWAVVPDRPRRELGFAHQTRPGAVASMRWQSRDALSTQLIEDLASLPGQGLEVALRPRPQAGQTRWEAQIHVVTAGDDPSLRMRAAVRRRFAGLQVAGSPTDSAVSLEVGSAELAALLAIPVAGSEPLPGAYTAPAAPIALAPNRANPCEAGLRIGHAVTGGGRAIPVKLGVEERLRHIHVLGSTGTGKSTALAAIVRELACGTDGALVADPHGQLCDRILAELPDAALERAWLIRCGDVNNPVPMNPLAETDPVRRDIAIADVCATFQYLFDKNATGIVGPRFHERVAMTLRALAAAHGPRASLLDVPTAAADTAFMDSAVRESGDQRLKTWWHTDKLERKSSEHGQVVAWVNSKFEAFSSTAAMRGILGSGTDAIDFAEAIDHGRIILLDLSKAELGEAAGRLLGFMYLSRVWNAALRRKHPERPFTVVVDEAHTLIAGKLANMLAEGRKFGLSVVLAHQYLDQLDADLRPAVDGNVATTIAFRCAVGDAAVIYKRFGGLVDPSVLVTLPELTAVSLRTAQSGPAHPYTLMIDHNRRTTPRVDEQLTTHVEAVKSATWRDLVDPYRDVTSAAVDGVSNVTTPARTSESPTAVRPPTPSAPTPTLAKSRLFLDEWLRTRMPSGANDDGGSVSLPESQGKE